ncbi:MAG: hypothetical protein PHW76_00970 [Alphaproteobacteria bacterium]|nr:hypothetical protein [Alphaproteobacteria bacterium]
MAAVLCVFGACLSASASAQSSTEAVPVASTTDAVAVSSPAKTVQSASETASPATGSALTSASATSTTAAKESIEKSMAKIEDKLIESAKADVKKLDNVSDETTLSELNRVRQTISRIEAMIDVEKRLNELEKIRNDRNKNASTLAASGLSGSLAAAIPASALAMPRSGAAGVPGGSSGADRGDNAARPQRVVSSPRRPALQRIAGAAGKYMAIMKVGEETKSLRIGDKVSDGEYVRSITSSSVEIGGKRSSYTLRVKNVDSVHGIVR